MSEENGWVAVGNTEPVEIVEASGPELMSEGSYAIYRTPSGGWHVAYLPTDTEKTQHFEIPAIAVQLFQQMQAGNMPSPVEMLKKMVAARGQ
jgi:hypothetical protein